MHLHGLTADATVARENQLTAFPRIAGRLVRAIANVSEFWVLSAATMMFLAGASAVALRAFGAITAFY
jgi:hypothetical protein